MLSTVAQPRVVIRSSSVLLLWTCSLLLICTKGTASMRRSSPQEKTAAAAALSEPSASQSGSIICSCVCCLQGSCVPVANTTWLVPSCSLCSQAGCMERVAAVDAYWSTETFSRHIARSACFVLHTTEEKLCSGLSEDQCKRYTDIKPQCERVTSYFQTFCCVGWTAVVVVLLVKKFAESLHTNPV